MENALIVLESDERGRALLTEAAELAAGVDATLNVLSLMTPEEFNERREALEAAAQGEHTSYDENAVIDRQHQDAQKVVDAEIGDLDVDVEVVAGRIGEAETEADRILEAAEDNDIDHVFLAGQKRSPTGKAVFGDRTQSIILNFEGPVTTLLG